MTSRSAIYEGTIRHRRFAVREHEFRYRIAMAYIDLDELPTLLGGRLVRPRPGLARFRRSDYLGDPATPLDAAVRDLVAQRLGSAPEGPIRLLTHLRTFGHCFNPVSFYYCFAPDGDTLEAIVAEVTNTPWGERHAYVLKAGDPIPRGGFDKALHVSPFMPMDQRYTWRAPAPGETLSVQIESARASEKAFDATLGLKRRPLTRRALARHPAATLRMLALIYGHAVALKLKGVPVQPHPAR
ncbi:MAG: DUF1365 domain-containing protein [Solirubrobacteraceae bacterium]